MSESKNKNDWWVVSTAMFDGVLILECRNTRETACVANPTKEEWSKAFNASTNPYRWMDESRVITTAY